MSDIFIGYKSEEEATARRLADALERHGWSVWWDTRLITGDRYDKVIEAALMESRCAIVLWSKLSVESEYVLEEAHTAKDLNKLVPVAIDETILPFGFKRLQTLRLLGWDGSEGDADYLRLVEDITSKVGKPTKVKPGKKKVSPKKTPSIARAPLPEKKKASQSQSMTPGEVFRDQFQDGGIGPEMVVIPAGEFWMGSDDYDDEQPRHKVVIARPFAMGRYAVTFEVYDRFAVETNRKHPDDEDWEQERMPLVNVLWKDAIAYTKWLSEQAGKEYRLPTEAEWEYAARAGTTTEYWWGDEVGKNHANCDGCGSQWDGEMTAPVGSFKPNPFGLYNMSGNVYEWLQDCYVNNYEDAPSDGSAREAAEGRRCNVRVLRGGSWGNVPQSLRSATRGRYTQDARYGVIGFRLARTL